MALLREYVAEYVDACFGFWKFGETMKKLGITAAALIVALGIALGYRVNFTAGFGEFAAVAVVAWLAIMILIVVPFRMWKAERARVIELQAAADKKAARRSLFDEIGDLRVEVSQLFNAMLAKNATRIPAQEWERRLLELQERIGERILKFAGRAEAQLYMNRGKLPVTVYYSGMPAHQLQIDIVKFDLDVLRQFIDTHSPLVVH